MGKIRKRREPFNGGVLPLFQWAESQPQRKDALPYAARHLKARHGLCGQWALIHAELLFHGCEVRP